MKRILFKKNKTIPFEDLIAESLKIEKRNKKKLQKKKIKPSKKRKINTQKKKRIKQGRGL